MAVTTKIIRCLLLLHVAAFEVTLGLCLSCPAELKPCYSCVALVPWQSGCDGPEAGCRLSLEQWRSPPESIGGELYQALLGMGAVRICGLREGLGCSRRPWTVRWVSVPLILGSLWYKVFVGQISASWRKELNQLLRSRSLGLLFPALLRCQ